MLIGWLLYLFTAICWTLFALRMQFTFNSIPGDRKLITAGIINFVFCPICIIWAVMTPKWWDKNTYAGDEDN